MAYIVLGTGYATPASGLLVIGARRQRDLQRSLDRARRRRSASGW
jgi:hypothetical protein